jgi:hypothetical protein
MDQPAKTDETSVSSAKIPPWKRPRGYFDPLAEQPQSTPAEDDAIYAEIFEPGLSPLKPKKTRRSETRTYPVQPRTASSTAEASS